MIFFQSFVATACEYGEVSSKGNALAAKTLTAQVR